jgi:AcrR family transcriptional regulator
MPKRPDPARRILDAALALAARQPWRRTSLADIAAEAGMPILAVHDVYRSKAAILDAFRRRIDGEVLAGAEADRGERARDRLFDTIMRRFDSLAAHKAAVRELTRGAAGDPSTLRAAPGVLRSMSWMLEASGIDASGWRGLMRAQLLACLYAAVLRVWLEDDSPDMTRTMAVLDRRLRSASRWLGLEAADGAREAGA